MVNAIPKPIRDFWDAWSIRSTLIFSLSLQTFLIIFAPQRKRSSNKMMYSVIWAAYLLADWSANFAAGQIADTQGDDPKPGEPEKNKELLAFWAPFLLLHLGGPDTITALALEDNELWLRHLLGLFFQIVATVYVFLLSLPNPLWKAILLVFSAGLIKYVERTLALYLASLDNFKDSVFGRPDPGPNYAKLMDEYTAKKAMNIPTKIIKIEPYDKDPIPDHEVKPRRLTPLNILQYAYKYFNIFKGLVVGLIFTSQERAESRRFFSLLNPEEALRILEVELNFIYESLYTKAEILHNWIGFIFRFIALGCLIAALRIFQYRNKDKYVGFDVGLTYSLLIGGIALDCIALIMFCTSDWTFARLKKIKDEVDMKDTHSDHLLNFILWRILHVKDLKTEKYETCFKNIKKKESKSPSPVLEKECHRVLDTNFIFRRWSEYVHGHNLIEYCLCLRPKPIHYNKGEIHKFFDKLIEYLYIGAGIRAIINIIAACFQDIKGISHRILNRIDKKITFWCKEKNWLNEEYIRFCFYYTYLLTRLPGLAIKRFMDLFDIQDHINDVIYTSSDRLTFDLWEHIFSEVKNKSEYVDNAERATRVSSARGDWTLRYIRDEKKREKLLRYVMEMDYDQSLLVWHIATELLYQKDEGKELTIKDHEDREHSKILSDYMMYLIMMQPTLMSAVGGIGKIRFRDTCEEAQRFFDWRHISNDLSKATEAILSVGVPAKAVPMDVKGDRSKSVLFDGAILAKELLGLNELSKNEGVMINMWEIVSKMWVELLSFAATNCEPIEHAAQLSRGGELITFVWLLMAHLGLGDQYQINQGDGRTKLIIGK